MCLEGTLNVSVRCLERVGKVSDSYWNVSGKGISRVFCGCFKEVPSVAMVLHFCFKCDSRVFQLCV